MGDTRAAELKRDQRATRAVVNSLVDRMEAIAVQLQEMKEQSSQTWVGVQLQLTAISKATRVQGESRERAGEWMEEASHRSMVETQPMREDRGNFLPKLKFPDFDGSNLEDWVGRSEQYFELEQTEESKKARMASVYMYGKALHWHFTFIRNRRRADLPAWTEYVEALTERFGKAVYDDPMGRLNNLKQGGVKADEEMDEMAEGEISEADEQTMPAEKDFAEKEKDGDDAVKMVDWSGVENETNGFEGFSDKAKNISQDRGETVADEVGIVSDEVSPGVDAIKERENAFNTEDGDNKEVDKMGDIGEVEGRFSDNCGITPHIFEYPFTRIRLYEESRKNENLLYRCQCSYLEIYNEQITDLNLKVTPQLVLLGDDSKDVEELMCLTSEKVLLKWMNFHLKRAGYVTKATNLSSDLKDREAYAYLLNVLALEHCTPATLDTKDPKEGARLVLVNAEMMIEDVQTSREEGCFRLWINSFDIEGYENNVFEDIRKGWELLEVLDKGSSGSVMWKLAHKPPIKMPSRKVENCNQVLEVRNRLKFSLVNIGGNDIAQGSKKLILAFLWQLMKVKSSGGTSRLKSFKDKNTQGLGVISSLIRHNKSGIAAFRLANGYATLKDALSSENVRIQRKALNLIQYLPHENDGDWDVVRELGFPRIMMHLTDCEDSGVREATLRSLLELARDKADDTSGRLADNEENLKQLLEERIRNISSMTPDDLGAAKEERQLVDSICDNQRDPVDFDEKTFKRRAVKSAEYGTTSVVIVAAEFLKRADDLVKNKVHLTSIISGYRLAMREAGDSDFVVNLVVDAVQAVRMSNALGEVKYPIKGINILKAHRKSVNDSYLLNGYALNTGRAAQGLPIRVVPAKIARIDLNFQKTQMRMSVQDLSKVAGQIPNLGGNADRTPVATLQRKIVNSGNRAATRFLMQGSDSNEEDATWGFSSAGCRDSHT